MALGGSEVGIAAPLPDAGCMLMCQKAALHVRRSRHSTLQERHAPTNGSQLAATGAFVATKCRPTRKPRRMRMALVVKGFEARTL